MVRRASGARVVILIMPLLSSPVPYVLGQCSVARADSAMAIGSDRLQENDPVGARVAFEAATRAAPNCARAFMQLGLVDSFGEEPERALEDLRRAEHLGDRSPELYLLKAQSLLRLERWEEVVQTASEALRLRPDYADAFTLRGTAYFSLSRYAESLEDFDAVVRLQPEYADGYQLRGGAHLYMESLGAAIVDFSEALVRPPKPLGEAWIREVRSGAFGGRARAYYLQGDLDLALLDVNETLALKTNYPRALLLRGQIRLASGRNELAAADLQEAVRLAASDEVRSEAAELLQRMP